MFGGLVGDDTITDELWEFDLGTHEWTLIDLEFFKSVHPESTYLATSGHTAHIVDDVMHVIFGHSAIYGYLNAVQECNMGKCSGFFNVIFNPFFVKKTVK